MLQSTMEYRGVLSPGDRAVRVLVRGIFVPVGLCLSASVCVCVCVCVCVAWLCVCVCGHAWRSYLQRHCQRSATLAAVDADARE